MKQGVHPKWNSETLVSCACGNTFTVGSTVDQIQVEICDKCHPFYTGEMKYVDTLGRVDKFKQKQEKAKSREVELKEREEKRKQLEAQKKSQPKSLKDMLKSLQ